MNIKTITTVDGVNVVDFGSAAISAKNTLTWLSGTAQKATVTRRICTLTGSNLFTGR